MTYLGQRLLRRTHLWAGRVLSGVGEQLEARREQHRSPTDYEIEVDAGRPTDVEAYWTNHTVNSAPFRSSAASLRYLEWRSREYPMFQELMGLWGSHHGKVVLDYGCGPGNDLVGFLHHGGADQVIGIDVSLTALELARQRLAVHAFDPNRVRLIKTSDSNPLIPLESGSVDEAYCTGVVHHSTEPAGILRELARVLRPGGTATLMVYNRSSIWFHLYVPYVRQIVRGIDSELRVDDAFRRSTDGEACPVATAYEPSEFVAICRGAGLLVSFAGAYFSRLELDTYDRFGHRATKDLRLAADHRAFLDGLRLDAASRRPMSNGTAAGIGGVFHGQAFTRNAQATSGQLAD